MKKEIHGQDLVNMSEIIKLLEKDTNIKKLWLDYKDNHNYSKNVQYIDVINALKFINKQIM